MTVFLDPPRAARNGCKLRGLLICRVSDPETKNNGLTKKKMRRQDERSLEDQEAMLREWVAQHTSLSAGVGF
jgi:hypothetical protein